MPRRTTVRFVLVLGAALLAAAAAIAQWESGRFRESEYREFRDRSLQMAEIFARSAGAWLVRGNRDALEGATKLLLAGSGQYVRLTVRGEVVLEERVDDPRIAEADLSLDPGSGGGLEARTTLRPGGLDVVFPLELPGEAGPAAGSVQLGFSDTFAALQVRTHQRFIFGLAGGLWLIVMLLIVVAGRALKARREEPRDASASGVLRCGELEIDIEACAVRLFGQEIVLTPKTFDLLAFLARHAGRTFSDGELLQALWSDSPYAASGDVKQCVYMLRRHLGAAHPDPKRVVVNVKGFGYRLEPPTEVSLDPN
jgi:DNA-binding winged helix-turn-helix (wHTH) protein